MGNQTWQVVGMDARIEPAACQRNGVIGEIRGVEPPGREPAPRIVLPSASEVAGCGRTLAGRANPAGWCPLAGNYGAAVVGVRPA